MFRDLQPVCYACSEIIYFDKHSFLSFSIQSLIIVNNFFCVFIIINDSQFI
jgi:hypothetical protein